MEHVTIAKQHLSDLQQRVKKCWLKQKYLKLRLLLIDEKFGNLRHKTCNL